MNNHNQPNNYFIKLHSTDNWFLETSFLLIDSLIFWSKDIIFLAKSVEFCKKKINFRCYFSLRRQILVVKKYQFIQTPSWTVAFCTPTIGHGTRNRTWAKSNGCLWGLITYDEHFLTGKRKNNLAMKSEQTKSNTEIKILIGQLLQT